MTKQLLLVGGPNGAGKTTAARFLLPRFFVQGKFLNADEIARQIAPEKPEAAALSAGKILLAKMENYLQNGTSFALESTCAGKIYHRYLLEAKQNGWRITLLYLWLPELRLSLARVEQRVRAGGHNIPAEVIARRYRSGLRNLLNLYLPLAEEAEIYDNSRQQRALIAEKRRDLPLQILIPDLWQRMQEVAK